MKKILDEFNLSNSTNYKLGVMEKYKNNEQFLRVLSLAMDTVKYNFYIRKIPKYIPMGACITLDDAMDSLGALYRRETTGSSAVAYLATLLECLSEDDAYVLERITDRDLKINFGRSQVNKIVPNFITKPPYMRCSVYSKKTASKIKFPAIVQEKCDGLYQTVSVSDGMITFTSRSGEEREFPELAAEFSKLPNGIYIGEMLVKGMDNRAESNGVINSDSRPEGLIYMVLWDYLTDYSDTSKYYDRYNRLLQIVEESETTHVVYSQVVDNIKEALEFTSDLMSQGKEGAVLKDFSNVFKDHTSPTQLKLKLEIDASVRIIGFTEGTKGTKREKTFGAIMFETDDKMIRGQCSGISDKDLEHINKHREDYLGCIMDVTFNDLSRARGNDFYALSHPRFKGIRDDIDKTDNLSRVVELKQMAMELS